MRTLLFGDRSFDAELVIFDKDGTLTDFRKTWLPLLEKRIDLAAKQIDRDVDRQTLRALIHRTFGIDGERIDPYGPFPYTPPWEDEIIFATALYSIGVPWQKGKLIARYSLERAEEELDRKTCTELFPGVADTLRRLKSEGLLLSVATADLTDIARNALIYADVYDLFDYIIGADMVEKDKPDPEMIFKTLEELQVKPEREVLVGDSITDMEMGRRAGLGLVVGVTEAGVATARDLARDADLVIPAVREMEVTG
jgi:phosphoglycolate phosphatase